MGSKKTGAKNRPKLFAYSSICIGLLGFSMSSIASIAELTRNTPRVQQQNVEKEVEQVKTPQQLPTQIKQEQPREIVKQETTRPDLAEIQRKQALANEEIKKKRAIADSITSPRIAQPQNYNDKNVVPQAISQSTAQSINQYIMNSTSLLNNSKVAGLGSEASMNLTVLHGALVGVVTDKLAMGNPSASSLSTYNKAVGCVNGANNQNLYASAVKLFQAHNNASGGALNDMSIRLGSNHKAQCM